MAIQEWLIVKHFRDDYHLEVRLGASRDLVLVALINDLQVHWFKCFLELSCYLPLYWWKCCCGGHGGCAEGVVRGSEREDGSSGRREKKFERDSPGCEYELE